MSATLFRNLYWARSLSLLLILSSGGLATIAQDATRLRKEPLAVRLAATLEVGAVDSFAPSPDGKTVAVYAGRAVSLWDLPSGTSKTLAKENQSLRWSPDGKQLLTSGKQATVWDAATGVAQFQLPGLENDIREFKWSPDGRAIMSVSDHQGFWSDSEKTVVQVWDARTGQQKFTLRIKGIYGSVEFSPDSERILTGSFSDELKLWDAATGKLQYVFKAPDYVRFFKNAAWGSFSPNGKVVAVSTWQNIYLWQVSDGKLLAAIERDIKDQQTFRGFSPDGKLIFIYREHSRGFKIDTSYDLLDAETGTRELRLTGHNIKELHRILWSPDSKTVITTGGDKKYEGKIWNLATGKLVAVFPMVAKRDTGFLGVGYKDLDQLSFSPTGRILMAANEKFIRLWNPANGELLQTVNEKGGLAQWGPRGGLVTASREQPRVLLWEEILN